MLTSIHLLSSIVVFQRVSASTFLYKQLQDILSVVDVSGNKVFFINKETGQQIANPYKRQMETIWGICMYDDEIQPQRTGITSEEVGSCLWFHFIYSGIRKLIHAYCFHLIYCIIMSLDIHVPRKFIKTYIYKKYIQMNQRIRQ